MKTYTLKELVSTGSHARMVTDPSVIVGETYNGYDLATILDANATVSVIKTDIGDIIDDIMDDAISDIDSIRSGAAAGATALLPADIETLESTVQSNSSDISTISGKIPSQAASDNQLADKAFVNSSISTNTADFKGTYDYVDDLNSSLSGLDTVITTAGYTAPNNNDYCFIVSVDANGNTLYDRYKYNGTTWIKEYTLNNSSFTSNQWGSIQSGITSEHVTKLNNINTATLVNSSTVHNIVTLSQNEYDNLPVKDANTEYNII